MWRWLACALWLVPLVAITIVVVMDPSRHNITSHYHKAMEDWQQRQNLYSGPRGMNYLPTFIPLFAPYHAMPWRVAEILWRWTAAAGLAIGLHGLLRRDDRSPANVKAFTVLSLLMLPLCFGAFRNGQANAHFAAAFLLAALGLATERWWMATIFLSLAVGIKPLGIAGVGLAFAAYPRLWWRLAVGLAVMLGLPFLFGPPSFVADQYVEAFNNLRQCAVENERWFADINGLLRTLGTRLDDRASLFVRVAAAGLLALFCFTRVRPLPQQERALGWFAASTGFLMLFNPMNESNSYIIFGPAVALWAWHFFESGHRSLAMTLAIALASMSMLPLLLRPWFNSQVATAWNPAMAILVLVIVIWQIFRHASAEPSRAIQPRPLG